MNIRRLWKRLFSPNNDENTNILLHIAGATVRHRNPFEKLDVPRNEEEFSEEFIDKWVVPFYMTNLSNLDEKGIKEFANTAKEINIKIVKLLLGDFDWRTRIVGAFFAAINNYQELEEIIGKHLLKSEVCYAGSGYCLALATFGTDKSKEYLQMHLDYYLTRKDLWFDQEETFCALDYLDKSLSEKLYEKWQSFVKDKEYWDLEKSKQRFSESLLTVQAIRKAMI